MKTTTTMLLLLICIKSFSQTTIIGNVSSENTPLVGANIIIKHSDRGTMSDFDGNFQLKTNLKDTLVVSYLGFDSKEIVVGQQKNIKVSLEGNIALDEVEIVAYGTTKSICVMQCYGKSFCKIDEGCNAVVESSTVEKNNSEKFGIIEKLYPNPSKTGVFQLKLIEDYKTVELQVFNMSGQLIQTAAVNPLHKTLSLDLSAFSSGIYLVNINANGKNIAIKKAIID